VRLFSLDKRLLKCSEFIEGKFIVDIGSDHAKLPIWLSLKEKIHHAIACDISLFSINRIFENIKKYKVEKTVEPRFSDGLSNVKENEIDSIIIAGLGGETISKIISNCKWKNKSGKLYILQPMTAENELRIFLAQNKFSILKEEIVISRKRLYVIIKAEFTNNLYNFDPLIYPFLGKLRPGKLSLEYVKKQIINIENRILGAKSCKNIKKIDCLNKIMKNLNEFLSKCG
jgi:tRNA (adenine22-N1)-methyltransferase